MQITNSSQNSFETPPAVSRNQRPDVSTGTPNSASEANLPEWATTVLPSCARVTQMGGLDEWSTIIGLDNFDICPSCLVQVFGPTPYLNNFVPARQRYAETAMVFCYMSQPFIRLSWVVARSRLNFELFKAVVATLTSSPPCPGQEPDNGPKWMVPGTDIDFCDTCYRIIMLMFPTCGQYFVVRPDPSPSPRTCNFMPTWTSSRYSAMVDGFLAVQAGLISWEEVDFWMKQRSHLPECGKDSQYTGRWWHRCPEISSNWVTCQECYIDVISTSTFESKFTRIAAPDENSEASFSCQIYSERMRGLYSQACTTRSFSDFATTALERLDIQNYVLTQSIILTQQIEIKQSLRNTLRLASISYRGNDISLAALGGVDPYRYGNSTIGWHQGHGHAIAAEQDRKANQLDLEILGVVEEKTRILLEWRRWE